MKSSSSNINGIPDSHNISVIAGSCILIIQMVIWTLLGLLFGQCDTCGMLILPVLIIMAVIGLICFIPGLRKKNLVAIAGVVFFLYELSIFFLHFFSFLLYILFVAFLIIFIRSYVTDKKPIDPLV